MSDRLLAVAVTAFVFAAPTVAVAVTTGDLDGWLYALAATAGGASSGAAFGAPVAAGWRSGTPGRRLLGPWLSVAVTGYVVGAALCLLALVAVEGLPPHVGPDPVAFAGALAYSLVLGLPLLLAVLLTGSPVWLLSNRHRARSS